MEAVEKVCKLLCPNPHKAGRMVKAAPVVDSGLEQYAHFVGKKLVRKGDELPSGPSAKEVYESQLPEGCRILTPDSIRTMQMVEGRINFELDKKGNVVRMFKG